MGSPSVAPIRLRLLGAVTAEGPAGEVTFGSPMLRTLLALLAVGAGGAVTTRALIDEVWGESLPARPAEALQVRVSRLRKELRRIGESIQVQALGETYALCVAPDATDLHRFHADAASALLPGASTEAVLEHARRALATWRGEPFAGAVLGERLRAERVRAEERRLRVVERLAEVLLDLGRPDEAVDTVAPLLATDRGREKLTVLAATGLHRAGRTAEALAAVATTQRFLRDEFGLESSAELEVLTRMLFLPSPPPRARPSRALVGRDTELATLRALLDDPEAGAVAVLTGEAGIGKTSLMRAARDDAAAAGALVGSGTWDVDAGPWAGWAEALDELGAKPLPAGEPAVGRALRERLAERRADGPVVVTLDDIHHADSASLSALRAVARLGLPPGVVVLVAAREPDTHAHPAWSAAHADLALLDAVVRVTVPELDEPAVGRLVSLRLPALDARGARRVADALWARTHGHALHVAALLESLHGLADPEACLALAAEVPDRLRPLLDHQRADLPPESLEALEALAVLAPISLADLASTLGADPRALAAALRPAVDRGLLRPGDDGFVFRHALTRDAVREGVPAATVAALHHARWQVLAAGDPEPFELLRHALGAGALVPAVVVADARHDAGVAAYRRGALDEALALLGRAEQDASRPSAVGLYRGLVLEALGRLDDADDALDAVVARAVEARDAAGVADAVVAAVGHDAMGIAIAGRPRRAERLRRVRGLELTDRQRVEVLRALILEEEQLLGDADDAALPELLALTAQGLDDPRLLAGVRVLEANHLADAAVPAAERLAVCEDALALATAADEDALCFEAQELRIAALLAAGRCDDALAARHTLEPRAVASHHPRSIWMVALFDAALLLARGDADAADAAALAALTRGQELGLPDALGAYGVHLLARHWLAGTLPTLNGLPAGAASLYPHVAAWSAAAAVDATQAGDFDTAAAHLADWHRKRDGREGRLFDRPGLCLAAAAAFSLGDRDTASAVLRGLPEDPDALVVVGIGAAVFGPVDFFRGLAIGIVDGPEAARPAFARARDLAGSRGWTPWASAAAVMRALTERRRPAARGARPLPPDVVLPLGLHPPP